MNEAQRQALLTAAAFASVFINAAAEELRGLSAADKRRESTAELLAALRALRELDRADDPFWRRIREEQDRAVAVWEGAL